MLETLFLLEEKKQNYFLLAALGLLSGLIGFSVARVIFPSQVDLLSVLFAAVPLIYSLTSKFLDDEAERLPHLPEVEIYLSIFAGQALAFGLLATVFTESFEVQRSLLGATGAAIQGGNFQLILTNNLTVFSSIFLVSLLVGSAGAFILSWNASVFGVFMSKIISSDPVLSLAYLPHSLFEMSGFVIAGIGGSLVSGAVYREHFDRETWKDYIKLVVSGIVCIIVGATLEAA